MKRSAIEISRALVTFSMFSREMLRSPLSMLEMYVRCSSARSANSSWDMSNSRRRRLTAFPKRCLISGWALEIWFLTPQSWGFVDNDSTDYKYSYDDNMNQYDDYEYQLSSCLFFHEVFSLLTNLRPFTVLLFDEALPVAQSNRRVLSCPLLNTIVKSWRCTIKCLCRQRSLATSGMWVMRRWQNSVAYRKQRHITGLVDGRVVVTQVSPINAFLQCQTFCLSMPSRFILCWTSGIVKARALSFADWQDLFAFSLSELFNERAIDQDLRIDKFNKIRCQEAWPIRGDWRMNWRATSW